MTSASVDHCATMTVPEIAAPLGLISFRRQFEKCAHTLPQKGRGKNPSRLSSSRLASRALIAYSRQLSARALLAKSRRRCAAGMPQGTHTHTQQYNAEAEPEPEHARPTPPCACSPCVRLLLCAHSTCATVAAAIPKRKKLQLLAPIVDGGNNT